MEEEEEEEQEVVETERVSTAVEEEDEDEDRSLVQWALSMMTRFWYGIYMDGMNQGSIFNIMPSRRSANLSAANLNA